jgi:hypothetical protein
MSANILIIDDHDLIEELRNYGEKNLPILTSSSSSKKSNQLNDQKRVIYHKKLNHYRAREKNQPNSNKQHLKEKNSPGIVTKIEKNYEDDDIIQLDDTSEYVQVSNAFTSPLSVSSHENNVKFDITSPTSFSYRSELKNSTSNNKINPTPLQNKDLNYVSLKDRIELDKTLSKYRSEINSIINSSIVKGTSGSEQNIPIEKYKKKKDSEIINTNQNYNDDIVYAGSFKSKSTNTCDSSSKVLYCPKPSILDSITNLRFRKNNNQNLLEDRINSAPTSNLTSSIRKHNIKNMNTFSNYLFNFFRDLSDTRFQISNILLYLIIIIFTVISLQYIRLTFFVSYSSKSIYESKYNNYIENSHYYCDDIKDINCSQTKEIIRDLIDYLRHKSGQVDCSIDFESSSNSISFDIPVDFKDKCIHITELIKYYEERGLIIKESKKSATASMLNAIVKNPQWQIRLLNSSYQEINDPNQVYYVMSTVSAKSRWCRAKELFHFIYVRVILITILVLLTLFFYVSYITYAKKRLEKDKAFYNLVSQVTNMVEKQFELSLIDPINIKPFIAISHIHDALFDASLRASNKKLWNDIVKFIQDHESRIHLMTDFIDGEETHVWKWIVPKQIPSINNTNKMTFNNQKGIGLANSTMIINNNSDFPTKEGNVTGLISFKENINNMNNSTTLLKNQPILENSNNGWQGDAFNRSDKLIHSPTPCLKIRNMFDLNEISSDSLLPSRIHNDILDKFNSNNNFSDSVNNSILHISCDKKSKEGCVYVKCKTNEAAGRVYQSLNGTWYNGKLLNVKFLRSDRYLERFPDSINYSQPLQKI